MVDSIRTEPVRLDGKSVRLHRLFDSAGRSLFVPMDHSVTTGPLGRGSHANEMASLLADVGADAIIVHKGRARQLDPENLRTLRLIVHLSAGTSLSADATEKTIVGSVAEAATLGADAVSMHVNVGSPTEARQLADLGAVAAECTRLGVPLLAMMYHRPHIDHVAAVPTVSTLSHLAAIATDLGADMVKLDYAGDVESMNAVVRSCPLPVLIAGGNATHDDDAVQLGVEICRSQVAGLSFGRQVFQAADPRRVASALTRAVHGYPTKTAALTPA